MKRLEITFSEEDVNLALETYINRFFLPHRQVRIESLRTTMREGRPAISAAVLPLNEPPEIPIVEAAAAPSAYALCNCRHLRLNHLDGHRCNIHGCACADFDEEK